AAADLAAFGFRNRRLEIIGLAARCEPGGAQHRQRRGLDVGFEFEQHLSGSAAVATPLVPVYGDAFFREVVPRVTERAKRFADATGGDGRTRRIEGLEHALVRRGAFALAARHAFIAADQMVTRHAAVAKGIGRSVARADSELLLLANELKPRRSLQNQERFDAATAGRLADRRPDDGAGAAYAIGDEDL